MVRVLETCEFVFVGYVKKFESKFFFQLLPRHSANFISVWSSSTYLGSEEKEITQTAIEKKLFITADHHKLRCQKKFSSSKKFDSCL